MGRPLYTTILLARYATQTIHAEPPEPTYPHVEKWSRWNAFDPDSDEFFDSENAVYEAFLSEDEITERAQAQQRENARLLAETLLREAETDNSSASSSTTAESDLPVVGSERISASRPATVQMDIDVMSPLLARERNELVGINNTNDGQQNSTTVELQPRRQPRRSPGMLEWSDGDLSPAPASITIPLISVVPVEPVNETRGPTRSPSPDPLNLVSGLQHLSESPRPFVPAEGLNRTVSPIPDTPARVSGVFSTPLVGSTGNTPYPVPTVAPRTLSWGSDGTDHWLPDNATPTSRAVFYHVDYPRLQTAHVLTST